MKKLPVIKKVDGIWNLFVDGEPFTALSGEVHNSSASNLSYMEEKVWPYLRGMNLNSLVVPVYWENIEPVENEFNFEIVDGLLEQARAEGMKLIILWFGLWKNGISSYVPEWVKLETEKYFRVRDCQGKAMDVVSPLCPDAIAADKKAFTTLMRHLKEVDLESQTVIMMQVENEVGLLGSDRDYSQFANKEFNDKIPDSLVTLYDVEGTWEEAFRENAAEIFMEYHYAKALEEIASAGKEEYGLEMYVNAWIEKFPWVPGGYPSGGPIARFIRLWHEIAPTISVLAPDIYASDFAGICDEYTIEDNPLMIPEVRRDALNSSNVFYAIGKYNALCYSPFGIEDFQTPKELLTGTSNIDVLKTLNIDVSAWDCEDTARYLSKSYEILASAMPLIRKCREAGKLHPFIRRNEHERGEVVRLKDYDIRVNFQPNKVGVPKSAGLILEVAYNEFYIMGTSIKYLVMPKRGENVNVGILNLEGGEFVAGEWKASRCLNGDERYHTNLYDMPGIHRIKIYKYI